MVALARAITPSRLLMLSVASSSGFCARGLVGWRRDHEAKIDELQGTLRITAADILPIAHASSAPPLHTCRTLPPRPRGANNRLLPAEIEAGTDMYQEPVFEKGASDFKGLGAKDFFITKKDMICDAYNSACDNSNVSKLAVGSSGFQKGSRW